MTKTLNVLCSDGETVTIEVALMTEASAVIANMVELLGSEEEEDFTLPIVDSDTLLLIKKWVELCRDNGEPPALNDPFFDLDLHQKLIPLLAAADYLDVAKLKDAASGKVATFLAGRSTQEMREILGIVSDFDPGEEEKLRKTNAW